MVSKLSRRAGPDQQDPISMIRSDDPMIEPSDPIADTQRWLERAVIGLNLCPFAKAVQVKGQIRYVLSDAAGPRDLLEQLGEELLFLRDVPAASLST
jgi:hypothetical protein